MRAGRRRAVQAVLWLTAGVGGLQLVGLAPVRAAADSFYVDKTMSSCSDTGTGTPTAPYCTITKAMAQLQPGTTLYIGDGTYAETIKPAVSGTALAPITVTSWPGRHPVVGSGVTNGANIASRTYVTVSKLFITGTTGAGILVSGGSHVSIIDNEVTRAGRPVSGSIAQGISLSGTSNGLVQGNYSHDNSSHGIMVSSGTTATTVVGNVATGNAEGYRRNANGIDVISPGNSVLGNVTHDNEDSGINIYPGGDNTLVASNVTYNNGDHGIDDLNVTGGRIIGNTVYRNCTTGINVEGTSGNYIVENNVAVDNAVYPAYKGISCSRRAGNIGIWDSAPSTTTVDHNLVYLSTTGKPLYVFGSSFSSLAAMKAATGQEQHGVEGSPRFANPSAWDLSVTAGSPAIDRANSGVSGAQASDLLGNPRIDDPATPNTQAEGPRPYDDLGAYEFQGSSGVGAPTARLTVTPTSGTAPLPVTADASGSSDPQGQALSYRFDFGDGSGAGPQSSATANHTYATAGTYQLAVTVTNTSGLSATSSQTVTASTAAVQAPTARLTVTPTSGTAPLAVTADASGSSDPQGQALSYQFDFGDGSGAGPQSSATANHTYATAGTYQLTVTVTNTSGLSATSSQTVTASTAAVQPPTARLTVTPTSGTAPLPVTADASGSSDPQGQALSYRFDFGDGSGTGPQSAATANHTYAAAGTYQLAVTVTNTSGLSATSSQTVTASTAAVQPPTARLTVTPTSGTAPLAVTADASGSSDPQGQALSYRFDFGDGSGTGPQSAATANHTYATAGTYQLAVTVTNTSGLSATSSQTVTASTSTPVAPSFVGTIANNYSTSVHTSATITVYKAAGVRAGDLVVLTLQLSGTAAGGTVSGSDAAGNTYSTVATVSDGQGNRLVLLAGVAARALVASDKLTVTFPSAATYRLSGDEFAGVTGLDQASTATGTASAFSSGVAQATAGSGVAFGAVSVPVGTANPTWSSGWTQIASYSVSSRYLSKAYELSTSGAYEATGSAAGPWLAAAVTFRP